MQPGRQPELLRRFIVGKRLGAGAYSQVVHVTDRLTAKCYALKCFTDPFQNLLDARRTYREVLYLRHLQHPNIVRCHQAFFSRRGHFYLLLECADCSLQQVLPRQFQPIQLKYLALQLFQALEHCHNKEIVHRDIKPANILLGNDCKLKLCDFGLSRTLSFVEEGSLELTDYVASRFYRPPQLLLGGRAQTFAMDIWAAGCVLAEMVMGRPLFWAVQPYEQMQLIFSFSGYPTQDQATKFMSEEAFRLMSPAKPQSLKHSLLTRVSPELGDLLQSCLRLQPSQRPTASQLLSHPYFHQFKGLNPGSSKTFSVRLAIKQLRAEGISQYISAIKKLVSKPPKSALHSSCERKSVPRKKRANMSLGQQKFSKCLKQKSVERKPKANPKKANLYSHSSKQNVTVKKKCKSKKQIS